MGKRYAILTMKLVGVESYLQSFVLAQQMNFYVESDV